MVQNYLSISIPEELKKFSKEVELLETPSKVYKLNDFGVKPIKNNSGNTVGNAYYSDMGELIKKVYYNGSSVIKVENFRNGYLYSQEEFNSAKILRKTLYDANKTKLCVIKYKYNNDEQICSIQKFINDNVYTVNYGYDELKRVNSRTIYIDCSLINEQSFKYDILDRIIEYKDGNQCIKIHKVNQHNDLVSYTIIDAVGNKIDINNRFILSADSGAFISGSLFLDMMRFDILSVNISFCRFVFITFTEFIFGILIK